MKNDRNDLLNLKNLNKKNGLVGGDAFVFQEIMDAIFVIICHILSP